MCCTVTYASCTDLDQQVEMVENLCCYGHWKTNKINGLNNKSTNINFYTQEKISWWKSGFLFSADMFVPYTCMYHRNHLYGFKATK